MDIPHAESRSMVSSESRPDFWMAKRSRLFITDINKKRHPKYATGMPTTQKKKGYLVASLKMMTMNMRSSDGGAGVLRELFFCNGHETMYP